MQNSFFVPYEELTVAYDPTAGRVNLETPWTTIEAEIPGELEVRVSRACAAINSRVPGAEEFAVSDFLSAFADHHVAYLRPRRLPLVPEQCSRTVARARPARSATPQAWIETQVPSVAHAISLRAPWSLDLDELLEASRIMGTNDYDAISAYRYLMRWAFRAIAAPSGGRVSLFDHLASALDEDESRFFESAKHYLRQYHHVTSTSFECLLPAAEAMPFARDKVLEVTLEEKGHGGFTADSLKALGVREPALLPLGPHVSALMDCLKLAAHVNPLAFSCLFNVFEMPGEQDQDPMAALLARSSKPEAARGLQAHFQLNKDGAHFTSGFELVGEMTAVDEYTVVEAARLTELHFMLLDEVCRDVMARGAH